MYLPKEETFQKFKSTFEFLVLMIIVVGIPIYIYFFQKDLLLEFKDIDQLVELINDNTITGSFIYIGVMIAQIIISILPGQVIQMMAGYIFPVSLGIVLSIIGAALGTSITYYLSKILGHDFVELLIGKDKLGEYKTKLNSKRAYIIVFLIYLIPGIPKDILGYAAGISNIDYGLFILVSTIGRIPGIIGCIVIGEMTYRHNYIVAIIIGIIATILFIIGLIYRKKIGQWMDNKFEIYMTKKQL